MMMTIDCFRHMAVLALHKAINNTNNIVFFLVAVLHPAGKLRAASSATARATLAHFLAEWHAGDSAGTRRGRPGARAGAPLARLPVQQPRQPAGAQRTHVVSLLGLRGH